MAASKRKRRKRKSSYWSPAAVAGRVVWGHGGFKAFRRRVWREWVAPRDITPARPDPRSGKMKAAGVQQRKDGTWKVQPTKTPKRVSPKKRIEHLQNRIATESDRYAQHMQAQADPQSTPMTKRVRRKPDGTWNGSHKDEAKARRDEAKQDAAVQREVRKASRNADAIGRHADELLGRRKPTPRRKSS